MKGSYLLHIGIALLLSLAFGLVPIQTNAQNPSGGRVPVDALLLVDTSTGLQQTDPNNRRTLLASEIGRFLEVDALWNGPDDQVGLAFFAKDILFYVKMVHASSDLIRSGLIEAVPSQPETDFSQLFEWTVQDSGITTDMAAQRRRVVILLTDGEPDFALSNADRAAGLTPVRKFFDSNPLDVIQDQGLDLYLVLVEGTQPSIATEWEKIVPADHLIRLDSLSDPTTVAGEMLTTIEPRFASIVQPPSAAAEIEKALPPIIGAVVSGLGLVSGYVAIAQRRLGRQSKDLDNRKPQVIKDAEEQKKTLDKEVADKRYEINNTLTLMKKAAAKKQRDIDRDREAIEQDFRNEVAQKRLETDNALRAMEKELVYPRAKVQAQSDKIDSERQKIEAEKLQLQSDRTENETLIEATKARAKEIKEKEEDLLKLQQKTEEKKKNLDDLIASKAHFIRKSRYIDSLRTKDNKASREKLNDVYIEIEGILEDNFEQEQKWLGELIEKAIDIVDARISLALESKPPKERCEILEDKLSSYQEKKGLHQAVASALIRRWTVNPTNIPEEYEVCIKFDWLMLAIANQTQEKPEASAEEDSY